MRRDAGSLSSAALWILVLSEGRAAPFVGRGTCYSWLKSVWPRSLSTSKRGQVFACQAPHRCFLINSINKAGVLPCLVGVLSLERCNPAEWKKDVHAVNLLLFK